MATTAGDVNSFREGVIATIERQNWLTTLGDRLQRTIAAAFRAGGEPGRKTRDFLHGTWLGHPLHPVLTDVPLGAWTTALVLDSMDEGDGPCAQAADAAITLGLVGAVAAATTGLTDWHQTDGGTRRVGLSHGLANITAAGTYAAALIFRRHGARRAGRRLAGVGFFLAIGAAYVGGHLVYRKRVGVDHAPTPDAWDDFIPVMPDTEVRESIAHRVEARGVAIVLIRRAGRIHAMIETCAHLGGPLSEGQMEGDSIRCPWHGSRFALADGRVLEGPSTFSQPCFDVRVRNGQVELRPRARLNG
jgi:nitrite reductase/ring-hydroxylating ferredoxin subunit/uncharacterized membrane protein